MDFLKGNSYYIVAALALVLWFLLFFSMMAVEKKIKKLENGK
ncbi:MAG: CcmD family protein [Ignavibacteria bacterium]|nr:CcmD family protein [Ignavibacteria bacterium]